MVSERTEEEILAHEPILVTLGGKEYGIAPLVIRDSREWRREVGPWKAKLAKYAAVDSNDDPAAFELALKEIMVDRINEACEFFFKYAKSLNRDEIENAATDSELMTAFDIVVDYAFPPG